MISILQNTIKHTQKKYYTEYTKYFKNIYFQSHGLTGGVGGLGGGVFYFKCYKIKNFCCYFLHRVSDLRYNKFMRDSQSVTAVWVGVGGGIRVHQFTGNGICGKIIRKWCSNLDMKVSKEATQNTETEVE